MGEALGSVYRDWVIGKRNANALKQGSGGPAIRRALELPVGQRRQRSGHPPGSVRVRGAKALDGFRSAGEVVLIQGLDFRHEHEAAEGGTPNHGTDQAGGRSGSSRKTDVGGRFIVVPFNPEDSLSVLVRQVVFSSHQPNAMGPVSA